MSRYRNKRHHHHQLEPEAAISLTGNSGVIGAMTGNTISFTDHNYLHYDQALAVTPTNYVEISWNEF